MRLYIDNYGPDIVCPYCDTKMGVDTTHEESHSDIDGLVNCVSCRKLLRVFARTSFEAFEVKGESIV